MGTVHTCLVTHTFSYKPDPPPYFDAKNLDIDCWKWINPRYRYNAVILYFRIFRLIQAVCSLAGFLISLGILIVLYTKENREKRIEISSWVFGIFFGLLVTCALTSIFSFIWNSYRRTRSSPIFVVSLLHELATAQINHRVKRSIKMMEKAKTILSKHVEDEEHRNAANIQDFADILHSQIYRTPICGRSRDWRPNDFEEMDSFEYYVCRVGPSGGLKRRWTIPPLSLNSAHKRV